jgi:hypothetical protein
MTKREVWYPAPYNLAEHRAIQTLAIYAQGAERPWPPGEEPPPPSPMDVKRALDWIVYGAAQYLDNGFVADDPNGRIAAYIDGRQSVAQQIVKLTKLKVDIHDKAE